MPQAFFSSNQFKVSLPHICSPSQLLPNREYPIPQAKLRAQDLRCLRQTCSSLLAYLRLCSDFESLPWLLFWPPHFPRTSLQCWRRLTLLLILLCCSQLWGLKGAYGKHWRHYPALQDSRHHPQPQSSRHPRRIPGARVQVRGSPAALQTPGSSGSGHSRPGTQVEDTRPHPATPGPAQRPTPAPHHASARRFTARGF